MKKNTNTSNDNKCFDKTDLANSVDPDQTALRAV